MQSTLRWFLLFIISLWQLNAYAIDETAILMLNQLLGQTMTMSADFTQTITDKTNKPLQKATGKMALQRPGKLRWEALKPISQLVVANGEKLWIYDPDLEQVTIRFISKEMGETPALLLSNTEDTLAKNFIVRQGKDTRTGMLWFVLTPKSKNSMLSAIKLGFDENKIQAMFLEDHLGHTTLIEFNHVIINQTLPSSLFKFKLPANVDVIDETQQQ
ncbi:MAG: outer membrane lipoprotein chaperone LolA [Gammaproteobacteria bacterium]|nr:outer membrane lipoprotein chaperone LolA [Gammaproteobacteria bacterium]